MSREGGIAEVDVAVVGSGFAGSILARALRARGLAVALLERGRHPRFALGESTTPLANLALERLAVGYGLEDLWELAAHGRWLESLPELGRGLKRGFTFYRHDAGARYDRAPESRLLVAGSPEDAIADTHWLRADVDGHFFARARAEGVASRELVDVELEALDETGATLEIRELGGEGGRQRIRARFVVDASGAGGFLARSLGLDEHPEPMRFSSRLLFSHFADLPAFGDLEPSPDRHDDPYPADRAAVHHLLDIGWMYQLRFDEGTVSAGLLVDPERATARGLDVPWEDPPAAWSLLVARHPSLERQFARARPLRPIEATPGVIQRRLGRAAGARWALLPQAFASFDPLFSTGIAWSLLAVERLAAVLSSAASAGFSEALPAIEAYDERLRREADQQERLLALAYRSLDDFERFVETSLLYFTLVSFAETRQRLLAPEIEPCCRVDGLVPAWAWDGFLSALDPWGVDLLEHALAQPATAPADAYRQWVRRAIDPRNVAGLGAPERHPRYPVDAECVVAAAGRLGLDRERARRLLPRLFSPRRFPGRAMSEC